MTAVVNAIGVFGTALTTIGFLQSNLPEKPKEGARLKVKAGLVGDDDPGVGGKVFKTYAWDVHNNFLGEGDGGEVTAGGILDSTIDSFSNGARTEYAGIAVQDDAVCVAWISVAQFDETAGGAWTGDIGYWCGQHWYENDEMAGYVDEDKNEEYIPKCTWLDADHTGDTPSAALKFYTRGYGEKADDTVNNAKECDLTLWGGDKGPINGAPEKRASRPRLPWMNERLVVSNRTQHKAENMCSSATSWGPDFVGTDGMFCDMETKTLTPLCSTKNVDGCMDVDDEKMTVKKRSLVARRATDITHKSYKNIKHWG